MSLSQGTLTLTQQSLLSRALGLLGGAVATAIGTGFLTAGLVPSGLSLVAVLAIFVLGFVVNNLKDNTLGYAVVIGSGALLGVAAGPVVSYYLAAGQQAAVINAALSTAVIFAAIAFYATVTRRDFTNLASFLVISMFALVIVSLLNVFLIHSSFLSLLMSFVVALISSGLILVRLSMAVNGYQVTAVSLAFGLLIDVYNLFMSLLRIFASRD